MPAASPLEAIEVAVATQLATVTDLTSIVVAPLADAFTVEEDGTVSLNNTTLPADYPGAVLSLNDEDITVEVIEGKDVPLGHRWSKFRAPVFIAFYAVSDGATETDARWLAWDIAHQGIVALDSFIPTGAPSPWIIQVDERMEPGTMTSILIDDHTHAMLVRFYASYYLVTTTT